MEENSNNNHVKKDEEMDEEKDTNERHETLQRVIPTICLLLVFFILGASFNLLGPSLVHLGYLYNVNIAKMSFTFTFFSIGYLLGSILCGTVFDRFNREMQFFGTCMAIGILLVVTPWVPTIYGFYVSVLFMSLSMGYLDSTGQPYSIKIWSESKLKGPIVQLLYSVWTLGNFVGPFVVAPFLVPLPDDTKESNCVDLFNSTQAAYQVNNTLCPPTTENSTDTTHIDIVGIEKVRYSFAIVGTVMSVASFSFIISYLFTRNLKTESNDDHDKKDKDDEKKDDKEKDEKSDSKVFKVLLLVQMFFFSLFLISTLGMLSSLLPAFVMKGLHWSVDKGPLISSVFMGAQAFARISAIPISACVKPSIILAFNVTLATVALIMMTFVESAGSYLMWISTALVGLGIGTTFPTALLWTSTYMQMTGRVGSIFFIGGSLGIMGSTALAGYLFENYSHMWVVYMTLVACIIDFLLFCCMFVFITCYNRKRAKYTLEVPASEKEMEPLSNGKS